jgi:protein-S-isoprenylcysteine O-methyltransferase Ste14
MIFNTTNWVNFCWIGVALVWLVGLAFTKRVVRRQATGARAFQIALGMLAAALMASKWLDRGWIAISFVPHNPVVHRLVDWIGLVLTFAGCLFACWARVALGGNWSDEATVKDNHELIVKGPYSLTRHPIYTGLLAAVVGTTLVMGQWRSIIGLVIVVLMLMLKMSQEERLMTQQFPGVYPNYRQRVKALIPGLF